MLRGGELVPAEGEERAGFDCEAGWGRECKGRFVVVKGPGSRDDAGWIGEALSMEGEGGDEQGGSL